MTTPPPSTPDMPKKTLRRFIWEHSPMGEHILAEFDRQYRQPSTPPTPDKTEADRLAAVAALDHLALCIEGCYSGHEIKTIRAYLTAPQPAPGWLPIASAPIDERVLAWKDREKHAVVQDSYFFRQGEDCKNYTYWQPLPPPPEVAT